LSVASTETVKAIAIRSDGSVSSVASFAYVITSPAPTASPAPGTYQSAQSVTLSDSEAGAVVHYTTDGSPPTAASASTPNPVNVTGSQTIKAVAVRADGSVSPVASFGYVIISPPPAPTASVAPGAFESEQSVTLSDTDATAVVYFTVDGSTPTAASPTAANPIKVAQSETIKAIAIRPDGTASTVASFAYVISPPPAPSATPTAGTFASAQSVKLTDSDPGAVVHYTEDGSTPTAASPSTPNPVSVTQSETIKAIAIRTSGSASNVASFSYVIAPAPAPAPTPAPASAPTPQAPPPAGPPAPASQAASPAAGGTGSVTASSTDASAVEAVLARDAVRIKTSYRGRLARHQGLKFAIVLPANAHSVVIHVLRQLGGHNNRLLYLVERTPAHAGGAFQVWLKSPSLMRVLMGGNYVLDVSVRRADGSLGPAVQHTFKVIG
jgi:hypothetical protein